MGEVIEFNNSINKTNKIIKIIIFELINNINKLLNEKKDLDEFTVEELKYLKEYFTNLLIKIKDRNWKISSTEEKFIKTYNCFKKYISLEDEVWKVFCLSELLYFTDINSSILSDNINYTNLIIIGLDINMESIGIENKSVINKVIKDVKKPIIKKIFKNYDEDEKYRMVNIIDGLSSGVDLSVVGSWYNDEEDDDFSYEDVHSLQNGILTIDRIYDFFVEMEEVHYLLKRYTCLEEERDIDVIDEEHRKNVDMFENVLIIKKFPEKHQLSYINSVREIDSKFGLEEKIKKVVFLTGLYMMQVDELGISIGKKKNK